MWPVKIDRHSNDPRLLQKSKTLLGRMPFFSNHQSNLSFKIRSTALYKDDETAMG